MYGAFCCECREPVDVPDQLFRGCSSRRVRPREHRNEEGDVAECEVLSALDVDGVVGAVQVLPETGPVRVSGESGLSAHEQEGARQPTGSHLSEQEAIKVGSGADALVYEHRRCCGSSAE